MRLPKKSCATERTFRSAASAVLIDDISACRFGIGFIGFGIILQSIVTGCPCPYFYDILDIVNKYFSVADMTGIQSFFGNGNDGLDRYFGYDNFDLDFRQQINKEGISVPFSDLTKSFIIKRGKRFLISFKSG